MEEKIKSFEMLENYCADEVKIEFDPAKFEMIQKDNGYYIVKKQLKYPKTYKECCDALGIGTMYNNVQGYKWELIIRFQELLMARDAYWKLEGEEMGLGKPWEPTLHHKETHYAISNIGGEIKYERYGEYNAILVFPTEKIRDIFYANFKNLIEQCKELL